MVPVLFSRHDSFCLMVLGTVNSVREAAADGADALSELGCSLMTSIYISRVI